MTQLWPPSTARTGTGIGFLADHSRSILTRLPKFQRPKASEKPTPPQRILKELSPSSPLHNKIFRSIYLDTKQQHGPAYTSSSNFDFFVQGSSTVNSIPVVTPSSSPKYNTLIVLSLHPRGSVVCFHSAFKSAKYAYYCLSTHEKYTRGRATHVYHAGEPQSLT